MKMETGGDGQELSAFSPGPQYGGVVLLCDLALQPPLTPRRSLRCPYADRISGPLWLPQEGSQISGCPDSRMSERSRWAHLHIVCAPHLGVLLLAASETCKKGPTLPVGLN